MRERLGMTQEECAGQVGIERSALVNYELGRTPLRYDIGLRICRQLIVSEEWLATGRYDACRAAAVGMGFPKDKDWKAIEDGVFFRQCVDLLSEGIALHIMPGTLFSDAYEQHLHGKYAELVRQFFHYPRLCFSDADKPELAVELIKVVNERHLLMLLSMAGHAEGQPANANVWTAYTRQVIEANHAILQKMLGKSGKDDEAARGREVLRR